MKHLVHDLWQLFYPHLCVSCSSRLIEGEDIFCLGCFHSLPEFDHFPSSGHPVSAQLQGLTPYRDIVSAYRYSVTSMLKPAFKAFKYGDRPGIGRILGKALGAHLAAYGPFCNCEVIIPVPLHHRKLRRRGYNQAQIISKYAGKELGIPVRSDILIRSHSSLTQTRKNKWQRQVSVRDSYEVIADELPFRSVLIIDDIITTGATIVACGEAFRDHPGIDLFAASVAFTQK